MFVKHFPLRTTLGLPVSSRWPLGYRGYTTLHTEDVDYNQGRNVGTHEAAKPKEMKSYTLGASLKQTHHNALQCIYLFLCCVVPVLTGVDGTN